MNDPLVRVDPRTSEISPGIATWEALDGGSRFVFRIRPGARFHNGRAVTAADAVFSLNRLAQKMTNSEAAFLLESIGGFEQVNVTGETPALAGLRALDPATFEIRLKASWMDFPYVLSHPSASVIPQPELEADPQAFGERPLGTGPYMLSAPFRGDDLTLRRFAGYRGTRPAIDKVQLRIFESGETAWRYFERGELDVVDVPPGRISIARTKYGSRGFTPAAAGVYLGFNLSNPKFSDPRFRQAVSLALDREAITRVVYQNAARPARSLVPRGIPGRSELACARLCAHDLNRSRELLRAAFPQGPPELAYDYPSGTPDDAVAGVIRSNLAAVGITVVLRPRDRELLSFFDLLQANQQEMFRLVWPAEYPHPDWFLYPLFRSGAPDNHTGYSVPEVDDLLGRARASSNRAERLTLYRQIERRVLTDMAVIPLGFFINRFVASDRVHGFVADPLGNFEISKLSLQSA